MSVANATCAQVADIVAGGYTTSDLKAANFPVKALRTAGVPVQELIDVGFSASVLRIGGCTAEELFACGSTAAQLYGGGFTVQQLRSVGFTAQQLHEEAQVKISDLRIAGRVSVMEMFNLGLNASELREGGVRSRGFPPAMRAEYAVPLCTHSPPLPSSEPVAQYLPIRTAICSLSDIWAERLS